MPRTSHSRFLQLHRRRQVAKLTLQGWTQVEIARQLNAAQSTISRDLEAVWKEWNRTARRTMRKLLDADLARIDLMEQELWKSWYESREPTRKTQTISDSKTGNNRTICTTTERNGDPRYMAQIQKCTELRRGAVKLPLANDYSQEEHVPEGLRSARALAAIERIKARQRRWELAQIRHEAAKAAKTRKKRAADEKAIIDMGVPLPPLPVFPKVNVPESWPLQPEPEPRPAPESWVTAPEARPAPEPRLAPGPRVTGPDCALSGDPPPLPPGYDPSRGAFGPGENILDRISIKYGDFYDPKSGRMARYNEGRIVKYLDPPIRQNSMSGNPLENSPSADYPGQSTPLSASDDPRQGGPSPKSGTPNPTSGTK